MTLWKQKFLYPVSVQMAGEHICTITDLKDTKMVVDDSEMYQYYGKNG